MKTRCDSVASSAAICQNRFTDVKVMKLLCSSMKYELKQDMDVKLMDWGNMAQ